MLSTILSTAIFISLLSSAAANSLAAAKHPSNISDLILLNNSRVYEASLTSNLSNTLRSRVLLPYGFSVPNTQTYLRLGFGYPRHRLDLMSMGGLIAVIQHDIAEAIEIEGEDAFPVLDIDHRQRLGYTLGDGFYLVVRSVKGSQRLFTWRQLSNVVEGLRLFLIIGERNYCTEFKFWDGPGRWRVEHLGSGGIVLDRSGAEEVADEKS